MKTIFRKDLFIKVFFAVCLSAGLFGPSVWANSGITYQGRLLKPNGTPVTSSSVQFKLQIRTPGTEDCLMYEEVQTADLSLTSGVFALSLGDGTGVRQDAHAADWTLFEALANRKTFHFNTPECTGVTTYVPAVTDNRKFRVFFDVGSGWEALPVQTINFIPMSIETYAVGGFPASSLLRVEDAGSLVNTAPLSNAQYVELLALLGGSSGQYEHAGELGGSALPSLGAGQTMVSDGSGGWSAALPLTSESDPLVSAFAKTALPNCAAGEVLKADGTSLSCVPDAGGWSAVDATDSVKGVVMVPVSGGLEVSSGSLGLPNQAGVTPGSATKVTVDAHGIITATGSITGADLTSGEIGGSTSVNTSGDLATTGDIGAGGDITAGGNVSSGSVSTGSLSISGGITSAGDVSVTGVGGKVSATNGEFRRLHLLDDQATPHYVEVRSPDPLAANYTLMLPGSLGSANQILGMNNAGNALENKTLTAGTGVTITHSAGGIEIAASGSGGTVTSVTGTAPIIVDNSNPNTPIVTLDDSGVGVGTYGSATEVPVITVDAKGRITSASNTTISGVSPAGSNLATGKAWIGNGTGKAAEAYLNVSDLKRSSDGAPQFPTTCNSGETLTWSSVIDVFTCSSITITKSQISDFPALGTAALEDVGTNAGDVVQLDPSGKLPAIDGSQLTNLPTANYDTTYFKQGGNDFSATATLGTTGSNDLNFITNNTAKMTIAADGSIGIGTTSPQGQLHIMENKASGIYIQGVAGVNFGNADFMLSSASGNGQWDFAATDGDGSFSVWDALNSKGPFTIETNTPSSTLYLGASGNVGIGTSSPANKLSVNGIIESMTGGVRFPDGTIQTTATGGGSGGTMLSQWPDAVRCTSGSQYWHMVLANGPWSDGRYYYSGATEWIGFNADGSYYSSSSGLSSFDCVTSAQSISTLYSLGHAYNFVGGGSNLWTASGSDTFFGGGKVGIGTTTPSTALEVVGTIKATGFEGPLTSTSTSLGDGSAGSPSMTFSSDPNTGFYSDGADTIGISAGGNKVWDITTSGIISPTAGGASLSSAAGSASAPTFSFKGDEDTGWYLAAPDTLAASTGGTERVRIDSSGNVGIGTTNPAAKLEVVGNGSAPALLMSNANTNNTVKQGLFGTKHYDISQLPFYAFQAYTDASHNNAYVGGSTAYGNAATDVIFVTAANNTTPVGSERMRINSSGNVGIGTATPRASLEISSTSTSPTASEEFGLYLGKQYSVADSSLKQGIRSQVIATHTTGTIPNLMGVLAIPKLSAAGDVGEATSFWARVDSVGTGTVTNAEGLFVADSMGGGPITNQRGVYIASLTKGINNWAIYTAGSTPSYFGGNVGIGTATPEHNLDIVASDASPSLMVRNTTSSTGQWPIIRVRNYQNGVGSGHSIIAMQNAEGTAAAPSVFGANRLIGSFSYQGSTGSGFGTAASVSAYSASTYSATNSEGELRFSTTPNGATAPLDRMVISSSGNVGIGTANPAASLHVVQPSTTAALMLERTGNANAGIEFKSSTGLTAIDGGGSGGFLRFYTAGSQRMYIGSNGNVGIGTSSPANKLDVVSTTASGYTVISNSNLAAGGQNWRWYSSSTGAPLGANKMCFGLGSCLLDMDSSGNVHASGTVTQSSDVRLKRDIHPIDGALDAVTGLQGVTYYWKDSEKEQSKQIGLIAQDVEKVFPEVVKTDAEGFKSVAYQNLVAPLISALREVRQWMFEKDDQIQALHREVASVKAESTVKDQKIQKLEKEIEGMKTRLDRIEKSLDQK